MNLHQVSMLFACILLSINVLFSQSREYIKPQIINYNYENKLRFEWPANGLTFTTKENYQSILSTKSFTKTILNNLEEIRFETQSGDPIDIQIYLNGQKTQMDIRRNLRPVSYQYKDTLLLFTGLHVIHLITAGQDDIRLYFDDVNSLRQLENISFDKIHEGIILDLYKRKIIKNKDLRGSREILYEQRGEDMVNMGVLKENANYRYGLGVVLGGMLAPGDVGVAGMTDLSRIKYTINSLGQTTVQSKISLGGFYAFLGNNDISTIGLSILSKPINPRLQEEVKLIGFGFGMVNMGNSKSQLNRTGGYLSWIIEKNNFHFSQNLNFPFEKNPLVNWSSFTTMVGYRF